MGALIAQKEGREAKYNKYKYVYIINDNILN